VIRREYRSSIVAGIGSIVILYFPYYLPHTAITETLAIKFFVDSIANFAFQFFPDELREVIAVFVLLLAFILTVLLPFITKKN
jgi:hypothetical protein